MGTRPSPKYAMLPARSAYRKLNSVVIRLIDRRNCGRLWSPPSCARPVSVPVSRFHDANLIENATPADGEAETTGPSLVRRTVKGTGDCPATGIDSLITVIGTCLPSNV